MEAPVRREPRSRRGASFLASASFLILIIGITYFAILVLSVHYGESENRAAAYRELGMFLSGQLEWYRDARVYGAASLVLALASLLCGVHPLARITLPVAGLAYAVLHLGGEQIRDLLYQWAVLGP